MKSNGKLRVPRIILHVLLLVEFLALAYLILSTFPNIPWFDPSGGTLWFLYILWIPVSLTSVICVALCFASRTVNKLRIIAISLAALYVPFLFLSGVTGAAWLMYTAGVVSLFAILVYIISFIKAVRNNTL